MKKSINVVLASVLAFSLFSVTAFADDPTLYVEYPESGEVKVEVTEPSDPPSDTPDSDTYTVEPSESPDSHTKDISVETNSSVSVWYTGPEGSNFTGFDFYLPSTDNYDDDHPLDEWTGENKPTQNSANVWEFTMPGQNVFVKAVFASPTPSPEAIPQSNPAPSQPAPVEEPQSAVAGTAVAAKVAYIGKSALPAGTVSFSGGAINALTGFTKNSADKFSATVLNLEAKDLTNQNGLAAYYAAIEGKEADILATYGIYASKNLSTEDNGKLTTLTWKNMDITAQKLDKNTRIKAVCYNLIDGTYTIEGEIDEFGNIILKNFIIRPTKTNITVFACK